MKFSYSPVLLGDRRSPVRSEWNRIGFEINPRRSSHYLRAITNGELGSDRVRYLVDPGRKWNDGELSSIESPAVIDQALYFVPLFGRHQNYRRQTVSI